jgi:outer membrane protein assembly factor BamB
MKKFICTNLILIAWIATAITSSADWPMYRANSNRDGYTKETIPHNLSLNWIYKSQNAPRPAWPNDEHFSGEMPKKPGDRDLNRMRIDDAFQPVIVQNTVIFGSSSDDQIRAIDLATGEDLWTFFTEGPVRFAPVAWRDRIFVGSDDGWLYAINAKDGRLLWKVRGGPTDNKCYGNERLVSHWPMRGGPVVYDDTVYCSAGIWPNDGIFILALNAETGEEIWRNDQAGSRMMPQPHGGAMARSGVTPQGYLAVTDDCLIIPNGRSVPAVFQRETGKLKYYHLQANQWRGGVRTMSAGGYFLNSGCLFDLQNGIATERYGGGVLAVIPQGMVQSIGNFFLVHQWKHKEKRDRKGTVISYTGLDYIHKNQREREANEIIVAASTVVLAEENRVVLFDLNAKKEIGSMPVAGNALGLAVSDGRLIVSTDQGWIYCFGAEAIEQSDKSESTVEDIPRTEFDYASAAEEIIRQTGVTEGICVDLGGESGDLALELAKRTELQIYIVESDKNKVSIARKKLDRANLYGVSVTVHHADPEQLGYPGRFANLVVSSHSLTNDLSDKTVAEMRRLQRPYGGKICIGNPQSMKVHTRGALDGDGSWTHQNANSANTICSIDEVKAPFTPLWYRDVDFELANRHGQGPAPLSNQGYLVVEGVNGLCALDAYNGRRLWTYEIKGVLKDYDGIHHDVAIGDTGGNYCLSDDSVYVSYADKCLRIDLATGKLIREYKTPLLDQDIVNRAWGYLAYHDGMVYGTVSNESHKVSPRYSNIHLYTESVLLFGLDVDSGEIKWRYKPEHSIRNNAIAVVDGKILLIDRPIAKQDRIDDPRLVKKQLPKLKFGEHPFGDLIALDAKRGDILWRQDQGIYGTQLALSEKYDIVLMNFKAVKHNFFELPSEIGGKMAAFSMVDGKCLWDIEAKYKTRPMINDDVIYAEGGAWKLKTGQPMPFEFKRSYGCGQICASSNLLLYRSATLGYWDLSRDTTDTENFGGIRVGCWFNAIPAGGMVLIPDGASKCACSYPIKAWMALQERNF